MRDRIKHFNDRVEIILAVPGIEPDNISIKSTDKGLYIKIEKEEYTYSAQRPLNELACTADCYLGMLYITAWYKDASEAVDVPINTKGK